MSAKTLAMEDYSGGKDYENPYPRKSPQWMEYYLGYFEMLGQEMQAVNEEVKGEMA